MSFRRRHTDSEAIARLGQQRRQFVDRAVSALDVLDGDGDTRPNAGPEPLRETTALLAASLEELKVAEEELVQQNEELLLTREAIEATSRHYRRLFEDAPVAYIVTDVVGIIRHVNDAAAMLLRRPTDMLEGKPLINLVPLDRRSSFRDAINRLKLVDAAHDWRVTLLRHGDAPVPVSMEARISQGENPGEDLICWALRPVEPVPAE
jgi:PAS domain S-box-containing protein